MSIINLVGRLLILMCIAMFIDSFANVLALHNYLTVSFANYCAGLIIGIILPYILDTN